MALGGVFLKVLSMILRALQFVAAIVILGIFSYFLVYLRDHHIEVLTWVRAVEGIAGIACVYTLVAFFLTCCLGSLAFFAFVAIVVDIVFAAAFIALTVLTDGGNTNCSALPPGSSGIYNDTNTVVDVDGDQAKRICALYKATFVLAICEIVLFIISAIVQFAMGRRHHQREKRRGVTHTSAGPAYGRRRWFGGRRRASPREMEQGGVPVY